jgi:hypothetical protein
MKFGNAIIFTPMIITGIIVSLTAIAVAVAFYIKKAGPTQDPTQVPTQVPTTSDGVLDQAVSQPTERLIIGAPIIKSVDISTNLK